MNGVARVARSAGWRGAGSGRARGAVSLEREARAALWSVGVALLLAVAAPAAAQTVAIVGARVHPVSGPPLDGATVLIRDGKIAALGRDVIVPPDAQRIDATGKVVTPGFLDSATELGVVEIGLAPGTVDASTEDDRITAAFTVADALNPQSTLIPVTRVEGITRAVVLPAPGASLIAGRGVLVELGSDRATEMIQKNPVGMFAVLGEAGAEKAGGARGAALLRLREALEDARDFAANRRSFEAGQRREYAMSRLDLEAMAPVIRGELPLALSVDRASDILAALRLAQDYGLELILLGAAEAWRVAGEIARAGVPVVINPFSNIPGFDNLGATLENAARLEAAGVLVAFATFDAHNSRKLKQGAGIAVAYGMPWEAGLRSVTLTAARIWGIADRYGSLEPGKDADVVIWSGDPFELLTRVEHVFIRGREVPPDTRQRELFLRYRDLRSLPGARP
ncbi:MAG: amidohydrolase family protein [Gemmatimonadetes bacterium]|nr:amidohydrolase family protein [Gemmatimonadota bacterium]